MEPDSNHVDDLGFPRRNKTRGTGGLGPRHP